MKVTVKANDEQVVPAVGYLFYIISSNGSVDVELLNYDHSSIEFKEDMAEGQGLGDKRPTRFENIRFINRSGSDVDVEFYAGKLGMFDKRVLGTVAVSGPVTVANPEDMHGGNYNLTMEGNEYMSAISVAGVASKYPAVHLLNPVGSGILVVLEKAILECTASATLYLRRHDVGLAAGAASTNKLLGGPAAKAECSRNNESGIIGSDNFAYGYTHTFETTRIELLSTDCAPVVIGEGQGVGMTTATPGSLAYANLHWKEVTQ